MSVFSRSDTPLREPDQLAEIVRDMGELFRQHVASLSGKIKALEERVHELEEHAEHKPKTVGADEYGSGDVAISDFESECSYPICFTPIVPGDAIVRTGTGHSGHNEWRHRDCN